MEPPPLGAPANGAREHHMAPIGLVRPVVAPGPLAERALERRRRAGVRRMYKRVNDFPVGQAGGAPGEQERGEIHGAPLTGRFGNPTIVLSHSFEIPDSIFNALTPPPRGFARRRATRHDTRGYR